MISIRNVEKFLNDHPEIDDVKRQEILEKSQKLNDTGLIAGGAIKHIMGDLASQFLRELTSSTHRQMGHTDIKKAIPDANIADSFSLPDEEPIVFFPEDEN